MTSCECCFNVSNLMKKSTNQKFSPKGTHKFKTWNDQFCGIHGNCGKQKNSTSQFQKLKFVPKALMTWFNLTYIFIPHQISNLFLVMWSQCFQNGSTIHGEKKSEENISLKATYLEPKPSFFIFFLSVARFFFNFVQDF